MRHISVLTAVYALVAVFALPGPLSASDEQVPAAVEVGQATPAAPESPPAPDAEAPGVLEGQAEAETPTADPETSAAQAPAPPPDAQQVASAPAPAPSAAAAPSLAEDPATVPQRAQREPADKRKPRRVVVRAAASQSVTIRDYAFSPRTVTVQPGDTVTWTNRDGVRHSATAEDGSFDTGLLGRGQSGEHTFREAGNYEYVCTPHPNMQGTVVVEGASTGGAVDSGADPGADDGSSSASGSGSDTSGSGSDTSGTSGTSSGSTAGHTSSRSTSTLPQTGADVPTLTLIGLLFLALGAAVQSRARRERSTTEGRGGS